MITLTDLMGMSMIRDRRYDFYKGLLMIGVTYGHVLTTLQGASPVTFPLHQFVRTYDMPMFAFISGIFLNRSCQKHSAGVNLINKIGGILFPCLIWDVIFNFCTAHFDFSVGRFWYTYSIFYVMAIIILIDRLGRSNKYFKFLLFMISIAIFHTLIIDRYKIGFLLAPAIVGYYYEGSRFQSFEKSDLRMSHIVKFLVLFIFVLLQCFWKLDYNVWNLGCDIFKDGCSYCLANISGILFRFAIGILGCFVMKWFFDMIYDLISLKSYAFWSFLKEHICELGMVTLEVYILQCEMIIVGKKAVAVLADISAFNVIALNANVFVYIIAPVVTVVSLYFLFYLQLMLKRVPLLGRYAFNIPLKNLVKR